VLSVASTTLKAWLQCCAMARSIAPHRLHKIHILLMPRRARWPSLAELLDVPSCRWRMPPLPKSGSSVKTVEHPVRCERRICMETAQRASFYREIDNAQSENPRSPDVGVRVQQAC